MSVVVGRGIFLPYGDHELAYEVGYALEVSACLEPKAGAGGHEAAERVEVRLAGIGIGQQDVRRKLEQCLVVGYRDDDARGGA